MFRNPARLHEHRQKFTADIERLLPDAHSNLHKDLLHLSFLWPTLDRTCLLFQKRLLTKLNRHGGYLRLKGIDSDIPRAESGGGKSGGPFSA